MIPENYNLSAAISAAVGDISASSLEKAVVSLERGLNLQEGGSNENAVMRDGSNRASDSEKSSLDSPRSC